MKKILFIGFFTFLSVCLCAMTSTDDPPPTAGPDASICEGETYVLAGAMATNYNRLSWTTSGAGSFNKPAILNPTYKPSAKDIKVGSVTLTLSVTGATGFPDTVCSMVLTIIPAPRAFAGGGDAIRAGDSYFLSNSTAEHGTHLIWSTSGTGFFNNFRDLHPTYTPSAEDIRTGSVTLTLTVSGKGSCSPAVSDIFLTIN